MKKYAKPKKVRKSLYLDQEIVDKIEEKAKKLRRNFNSIAVELLEAIK